MHVLDKGKKTSGKESVWPAEVTAEASRGNQSSNGVPRRQKHSGRVGEGQREPWTWPCRRGERLDTHTFLLWLYFLSLSPGCSQKPTPRSLVPLTPGESGPKDQQAPSCLGVFIFLLYTFCGTRRSRATEGHSSDCLGLAFMPL